MHATSSFACLFARYVAYGARAVFGWSTSCSWSASCSFIRGTLAAHTGNMEFSSRSTHSKIWLRATSYSSSYCNACWLHQILISDTYYYNFYDCCYYYFALKILSCYFCTNKSHLCIKFHFFLIIPSWCCIFYKLQYIYTFKWMLKHNFWTNIPIFIFLFSLERFCFPSSTVIIIVAIRQFKVCLSGIWLFVWVTNRVKINSISHILDMFLKQITIVRTPKTVIVW